MRENVLERDMKQNFCKLKMTKNCCFPIFLEEKSFIPLSFNVIFEFDFSPCINLCSPTLLLWGWVLNACFHINALIQNQCKYACEQTIHNTYG